MYLSRLLSVIVILTGLQVSGQGVLGRWKTIDDQTGKPISIIEIFEMHGKVHGRVVDILNPKSRHKKCDQCPGKDKGKPIMGLTVLKDLRKDGNEYSGGQILDPKHGKLYKCYISLEDDGRLKVRGYIGVSLLGRTQYWHRVNE